jgi:hypothetical protein
LVLPLGLFVLGVLGPRSLAWAGGGPLLVVVEAAPGTDLAPADVRAAIGAEVGVPVVSPHDSTAPEADRLLVVSLDGAAIRVTLRDSPSQLVTRSIAAPGARPARLQTIAWLAGNVARDQVSGIVEALPPQAPVVTTGTSDGPGPSVPRVEPPPAQPGASLPSPPGPTSMPAVAQPAETLSAAASATKPEGRSEWTVTAAYGTALVSVPDGKIADINTGRSGSIYEVRAQRRAEGDLDLGAAFSLGDLVNAGSGREVYAFAGLAGRRWDRRHWFVEARGGVGVELVRLPTHHFIVTNSSTMGGPFDEDVITEDYQPILFGTARGGLGVPLSRSFEALVELGMCLGSHGLDSDYVSTAIALRMRLP